MSDRVVVVVLLVLLAISWASVAVSWAIVAILSAQRA